MILLTQQNFKLIYTVPEHNRLASVQMLDS